MIRIRDKIYAENNDPNTVLRANTSHNPGGLLIGLGNKSVRNFSAPVNVPAIILISNNGTVTNLNLNGQINKVIGTDNDGNIVLIDRRDLI